MSGEKHLRKVSNIFSASITIYFFTFSLSNISFTANNGSDKTKNIKTFNGWIDLLVNK